MSILSRLFGSNSTPAAIGARESDLVASVRADLADVSAYVDREYEQCTPSEKRGMRAMRRMELFRNLGWRVGMADPASTGYKLISHGWWIAGLVLQRDRATEVKRAIQVDQWAELVGDYPRAAELAEWASKRGSLRNEDQVEDFSASVWQLLALPASSRIKP